LGSITSTDAFKWANISARFNKIKSWIIRAR
jgi:hypothetical protein